MMSEPRDQLCVPLTQMMPVAESLGIHGAQFRMVTAPSFGNIMVYARNIKGFQLW